MALELMVQGDTKKYELIFEIFFKKNNSAR
jgi:hypothetical protein